MVPNSGIAMSHFARLNKQNGLQLKEVFMIGQRLLNVIEILHRAGYIYNDLSFENISLGKD